jgi:RNA polymerase sigma-70 factor (ECF subfamily)
MHVNRLIPHFVSHFEAVVVTCSLWRSYCFVQRCLLFEQMARRYRTMEAFRASSVAKDSDAELVAATKRGETLAFEKLVLRYKRRVFALAQRITNNREDAEDVVQESFHKAFLHLHDFQERSQFSTWLTRIAMNEAFMLVRRRRGILEVLPDNPDDGVNAVSAAFVDQRPNPEESCWRRERAELVTEAINRLGPKIRSTILLRDIEEHSAEETALILGTSITAVKARVFQGRRKLRGTLNPRVVRGVYAAGRAEAQRCCT